MQVNFAELYIVNAILVAVIFFIYREDAKIVLKRLQTVWKV